MVTKPLFDAIVVEGGQSDVCLANPTSINQGDGPKIVYETNDSLSKFVASEEYSLWWRR